MPRPATGVRLAGFRDPPGAGRLPLSGSPGRAAQPRRPQPRTFAPLPNPVGIRSTGAGPEAVGRIPLREAPEGRCRTAYSRPPPCRSRATPSSRNVALARLLPPSERRCVGSESADIASRNPDTRVLRGRHPSPGTGAARLERPPRADGCWNQASESAVSPRAPPSRARPGRRSSWSSAQR